MAHNDGPIQFKGSIGNIRSYYGFRTIEPSKAPYLLREINFNQQIPFQGVIREAYSITFSQDKNTARFSMPGFIPRTRLNWPTPFQLFRFYLVIAQVSDITIYDIEFL